jgi:hypothetical protein
MTIKKSILDGVDDRIDQWLDTVGSRRPPRAGREAKEEEPWYASGKAAQQMSMESGPTTDCGQENLLSELLEIIRENWRTGGCVYRGKGRNWVLEKSPFLDPSNDSGEVVLERLAVLLFETDWADPKLFNQVATCSGLMPEKNEGGMHVDLVCDRGGNRYEFIELKYLDGRKGSFGSNNPLYAAFEVLVYGLLFIHAKESKGLLGKTPLQQAKQIQLTVLAPLAFYRHKVRGAATRRYELKWFETLVNKWFASIDVGPPITFRFQAFTQEFEACYGHPKEGVALPMAIQALRKVGLTGRELVYGD